MKFLLMQVERSRWGCLFGLAGTIVLGLATRDSSIAWPSFIALHAGDALWSIALYLGIAWLGPRLSAMPIFLATLGISYCVELAQLLDWHWLRSLRDTLAGRLLLGAGFQWLDFPRYTVGAVSIFLLDRVYLEKIVRQSVS